MQTEHGVQAAQTYTSSRYGFLRTRRHAFAATLIALLTSALPALGQDGSKVVGVRFEGLGSTSTTYATSVIRVRPGDALDESQLEGDVTRLLASGRFATADYTVVNADGGVEVVFQVAERPAVTSIRYVGNQKFNDQKLTEQVPIKVGDPIDIFRVREGADAILLLYRDEGYGEAVVTYDDDQLRETGELVYVVEEGPKVRVDEIVFEGNENFADGELIGQVTTKEYLWLLRDGKYDEDTVEADAASIQGFYRGQGYLDARVSYRTSPGDTEEDVIITFTINEGERYLVESVRFSGVEVFTEEEARDLITVTEGEPILQRDVEHDAKALRDLYADNGYIYVNVRPLRVFSEQPGYVVVTYDITEGKQYRVNRIVVRGNESTQDKVVRRELDLFPNDVFNLSKIREAEQSLRQTQLFSSVTVNPVGEEGETRDILVNVEEARKAGDFLFGVGVTSNSGLVGSVMLDIKNFDLFDYPRSFDEFFKLRSFRGAGQRLRIEAQPGTELTRFRLDFTEPYLLDQPVRFDWSLYYFERGRDEFDEERVGTSFSFGKRFKKGWLKDWYGELAFRLEQVRLDDIDFFSARDIRDDEGTNALTSIKVTLVRDRTDSRFVPTKGDRFRVSYEQFGLLGGDVFGKAELGYARHFTLFTDELERKSVLSLKGDLGFMLGDTPVYERFYAGGIGSIRGFQFRGVSPRDGFRDDAIGGEFLALVSAEYSFPLYAELLRGLVFTDMGTVESGLEITDWRIAVGAGVRLQVDFFGPVPLEFDVAVPAVRNGDDEEQVFSFFVGATF